jgi:hypothetical protein
MRVDIGENFDSISLWRADKNIRQNLTLFGMTKTLRTFQLFLVVTLTNIIYIIFTYQYGHSEIATGVITWSNTMNIIF